MQKLLIRLVSVSLLAVGVAPACDVPPGYESQPTYSTGYHHHARHGTTPSPTKILVEPTSGPIYRKRHSTPGKNEFWLCNDNDIPVKVVYAFYREDAPGTPFVLPGQTERAEKSSIIQPHSGLYVDGPPGFFLYLAAAVPVNTRPTRTEGLVGPISVTRGDIHITYTIFNMTIGTRISLAYTFTNPNSFDVTVDLDWGGQIQNIFIAANSSYDLDRQDAAVLNIGRVHRAE